MVFAMVKYNVQIGPNIVIQWPDGGPYYVRTINRYMDFDEVFQTVYVSFSYQEAVEQALIYRLVKKCSPG